MTRTFTWKLLKKKFQDRVKHNWHLNHFKNRNVYLEPVLHCWRSIKPKYIICKLVLFFFVKHFYYSYRAYIYAKTFLLRISINTRVFWLGWHCVLAFESIGISHFPAVQFELADDISTFSYTVLQNIYSLGCEVERRTQRFFLLFTHLRKVCLL